MTNRELQEKNAEAIIAIEAKNTHSDGKPYDKDVCLDMLKADLKAHRIGQELPYPFEGSEDFDWDAFESDCDKLD